MLLALIMLLGLITCIREGWNIGDSFYYAFITAFTIGYGDFSLSYPLTKIIAVVIGLFGFLFTGVLVAIAVESVRFTVQGKAPLKRVKK
jgi:voltage-gated potassium channel